jgi:PKD repeat protein
MRQHIVERIEARKIILDGKVIYACMSLFKMGSMKIKTVGAVTVILVLISVLLVIVWQRWPLTKNLSPVARAGPNKTVNEDETVNFNGSASSDPDGTIISYTWDLGDGTTKTGMTVDHVYPLNKTYFVILTVIDNGGASANDTVLVSVKNIPPIAEAGPDKTVNVEEEVAFDGSNSTDTLSDIPSLLYNWDFGDGYTDAGKIVTHAYVSEGTYTTSLTVSDNDGAISIDTLVVKVVSEFVYPRPLTLKDLDAHPEDRGNRENYWFSGNVDGDDDNRYAFRITTELAGEKSGASAWLHRFGVPAIHSENFSGDTIVTRHGEFVLVERGIRWQIKLAPNVFHLEIMGGKVAFNLTFTTVGLPFLYAKGEKAMIAQHFWGWGYEAPSSIGGTIVIQGIPITVEGKGVHEHFWGNVVWNYTTDENWLPIHFEEAVILLFRVDRLGGGAYEDGYIHLLSTDEYLVVNYVEVKEINENGDVQIIAKTEEGANLSLVGIQYAQFNPGHFALSFSGTLEYSQVVNLTNGDGWRESVTKTISG